MGIKSINEPETSGHTFMVYPISINEPPIIPEGGEAGPPVLDAISPSEAAIGAPDVTLSCTGSNFWPGSVITFNGGDEPTTVVSASEVTTIVRPVTASIPGTYPVTVKHAAGESEPQGFTFTEADGGEVRKTAQKHASPAQSYANGDLADPDEMEEAIEEEQDDVFKPLHASHKPKQR